MRRPAVLRWPILVRTGRGGEVFSRGSGRMGRLPGFRQGWVVIADEGEGIRGQNYPSSQEPPIRSRPALAAGRGRDCPIILSDRTDPFRHGGGPRARRCPHAYAPGRFLPTRSLRGYGSSATAVEGCSRSRATAKLQIFHPGSLSGSGLVWRSSTPSTAGRRNHEQNHALST
jgi:hypothetical protein